MLDTSPSNIQGLFQPLYLLIIPDKDQEIIYGARDETWLSHMQGKCLSTVLLLWVFYCFLNKIIIKFGKPTTYVVWINFKYTSFSSIYILILIGINDEVEGSANISRPLSSSSWCPQLACFIFCHQRRLCHLHDFSPLLNAA